MAACMIWSVAASASAEPHVAFALHVNGESVEQLAARSPLRLGWAVPPPRRQSTFSLRVQRREDDASWTDLGVFPCRSSVGVNCTRSDNVAVEVVTGLAFAPAVTYAVSVQIVDNAAAAAGGWSEAFRFAMALAESEGGSGEWPAPAVPVWAARPLQRYVLLRSSGFPVLPRREYLLHVTAHGVPMRRRGSGANASKLLGAYKLYVNGVPVSAGPGRPTGANSTIQVPAQVYDTVNATSLLRPGEDNVIAVEGFYWNNAQELHEMPGSTIEIAGDRGDMGGIMVLLRSGSEVVSATGSGEWLSYNHGDAALLPAASPPGCRACCAHGDGTCDLCNITGGRFQLMHERWNASALPAGWRLPGFAPADPGSWSPPSRRTVPFPRLGPKGARAIALVDHVPVAIQAVTPDGLGGFGCTAKDLDVRVCGDAPRVLGRQRWSGEKLRAGAPAPGYCYVVDMGVNIQGGINITFSDAPAGHVVRIMASELMVGMNGMRPRTGAVQPNGTDESVHYDEWLLRAGAQTVVSHEYIVARFWQVINAPELPSASVIRGWKAWYPLGPGGKGNGERGVGAGTAAQTTVATSSSDLDAVWALCRDTGRIGMMDVNTDSNARQRDNCNVDSHITALHQAAASQAASAPYRRRNAAFLFQPDSKVHPWTEFKLFSLGAVHEYTLDTGDLTLAAQLFDRLVQHYSLTGFIHTRDPAAATAGLVVKAPKEGLPPGLPSQAADSGEYYFDVYQDLIDYPDSADIFNDDAAFPEGARCCKDGYVMTNVSTVINAHVAHAHRRLAAMARWVGRPADEAAHYDRLADGIVAGLLSRLLVSSCQPTSPACFADGLMQSSGVPVNHTSVQATLFVVGCGLMPPRQALSMLPFLRAKTAVMPLFSAMASNFMLEGLYRMAAADTTGDAANFAFDLLTRKGHRSWLEMLAANATMTIEHWYGTFTDAAGAHTWSHPWSAAPARIIPQWLLGIRPLEPAWRRIAVHPQPGSTLTSANMSVPTHRGAVRISYERGAGLALNITVPGNTKANVCLPLALVRPGSTLTVDGQPAASHVPECCPGQLCLVADLDGGDYSIELR